MKLSILIPTYNRAKYLEYNLRQLVMYILNDKLESKVCICISDNASTDNTREIVNKFMSLGVTIKYNRQKQNLGYTKNVLSILAIVNTDWVMLLGDDDYLDSWYIKECLAQIASYPNLGCIIPNYIDYNTITNEYGLLREEHCKTQYYAAGFQACLKNSWRAHQLSGLCFRRASVVEEYLKYNMNNLYPQMFFICYNALKYDVLHFGKRCLAVSGIPQTQKDWSYGDDGLMNEICENFKNLKISYRQRALLESEFNKHEQRYLWACRSVDDGIDSILEARNITLLGKYYISRQFLKTNSYMGKKNRLWFYLVARIVLLKNILQGNVFF